MTITQIVIASTDNKYNQMMASRLRSMLNLSDPAIAVSAWSHDNQKQAQNHISKLDEFYCESKFQQIVLTIQIFIISVAQNI